MKRTPAMKKTSKYKDELKCEDNNTNEVELEKLRRPQK